jgi:hypothetical protein
MLATAPTLVSFNRQVREIEDGSLVVYTGGFPAAAVIELLSKVLTTVPSEVPLLHCGVRIFRYLEENLPRARSPDAICP